MLLKLLLLLPPVLWGGEWAEGRGQPTQGWPWSSRLSFSLSLGALAKDSSYRLVLQEPVTVQESLCVLVPCKFYYSWSLGGYPYLYWFKKEGNKRRGLLVATNNPKEELQETIQGRFLLLRDPKSNDCSLTIRDVNKRDSGTYSFYLKYGHSEHRYEDVFFTMKVTGIVGAQRKTPGCQVPEMEK